MTTFIIGTALFVVSAPTLFVLGLLVLHVCQYGIGRFFATMPEEEMEEQSRAPDGVVIQGSGSAGSPSSTPAASSQSANSHTAPEAVSHASPANSQAPAPRHFRKGIRTDPPALIRIKELGWRMPCGHKMHEWDSDRFVCLQCVLEGRVVARDRGRSP